jgi:hypothetical protein
MRVFVEPEADRVLWLHVRVLLDSPCRISRRKYQNHPKLGTNVGARRRIS